MRRLSKINESLFKKVIDRSDEKETRIENESDIERGYRIMRKLDTVSISGIEWVPFPFGSSKSDVPGLFLNYNEILELKEFLKGKGYRIASQDDFETLATYKNNTVKVSGCSTEYNGKTVRGFSFDDKLKFFYFGAILPSGEPGAEDKSAMFVTDIDENSKSVDVNTIVGDFKTNYVSMHPMSFKHYGIGYQVMIIKDDKVTESVFKKAIDRSDEKETRTEDSFKSNIKELKKVDLGSSYPVYFADTNLIVNGENTFDWDETENIIEHIDGSGWRLIFGDEVEKLFYKSNMPPKPKDNVDFQWVEKEYGKITSKETGEELVFYTDKKYNDNYWCNFTKNDILRMKNSKTYQHDNARGFEVGEPKDYYGCLVRFNNFNKKSKNKIRLVMDK